MTRTRRPLALLAPLLLALVAGCGVAEPQGLPSTAARVGDTTISVDEVDRLTDEVCSLRSERAELSGGPQTRGTTRRGITESLVYEAALTQLLDETGTELGADYEEALATSRSEAEELQLDAEQAEVYNEVNGIGAFIRSALTAVGEDALLGWLEDNDVTVNPVFGLEVDGDQGFTEAGSLSVPVSDDALGAASPSAEQLESLPDDQVCG